MAIPAMAVGVEMALPIVVMGMEVYVLSPRAAEHVGAEQHQHQADRELQRMRGPAWQRVVDQQQYPAKPEQRQGVTQPPGRALSRRTAQVAAACAQAGHGGQMIGLEGVLQTEQQAEEQDGGHAGLH